MRPNSKICNLLKPTKIRNKAGAVIDRKITVRKNKEIEEAVTYCKKNKMNGYAALKTGLFPNIKDRGIIDRRLKGKVKHECERDYCRVLTVNEENRLVEYIKNRNRTYQPLNRQDVSHLICNILRIRQHNNKKLRYRNCTLLSKNAKATLARGTLGKRFWARFFATHRDLRIKRRVDVSINRALNCTREMAEQHINELTAELLRVGIFEDAEMDKSGEWKGSIDSTRIFNHDETPQFIQYGTDGNPSGLYFAGKGEACEKLVHENRECVTIQPFVSFDGDIAMCQVIFAGKSIISNMVPDEITDKIYNLLISTTETGIQTARSLLEAYKLFDRYLEEKEVKRPVVLISDGHSSRFDLSFLEKKKIFLFLTPPETTGLLQLLDQINQMMHSCYRKCKDEMFNRMPNVNRECFMLVLSEIWGKWTNKNSIVNAARRVGVTSKRLSVDFMQKEKFEKAKNLKIIDEVPAETTTFSPKDKRKGSRDYYMEKAENLENHLKRIRGTGLDLDEVPGLLKVDEIKRPRVSKDPSDPSLWLDGGKKGERNS